jgi:dihydrofolate reductase
MPGKLYIAVTRDINYKPTRENATAANSLEEALRKASRISGAEEVFINGGAQMFEEGIVKADRLYLTIVEGDYDVDTYFPDYSMFKTVISEEKHVSKEGCKFKFLVLER